MIFGKYFCGNKISEYGLENHRVDYRTFVKAFAAVLNNEIMQATYNIGYWEQVNGCIDYSDEIDDLQEQVDDLQERIDEISDEISEDDDESNGKFAALITERDALQKALDSLQEQIDEMQAAMDYPPEVYQWYIVDDGGAEIIQSYTDEILYYNEALDMYLWGVTHYGTSWDYVLTDIRCNAGEEDGDND